MIGDDVLDRPQAAAGPSAHRSEGKPKVGTGGLTVLVCGGREFRDSAMAFRQLDRLHRERPISQVIHGGARGADTIGGDWARMRRVPVKVLPAQWDKYGPSAGPRRNKQMLVEGKPDLVVALPGGRGTANMVGQARDAGVEVIEVRP